MGKKDEFMAFLDEWADKREDRKKKEASEGKGKAGNPPKKSDGEQGTGNASTPSFLDEMWDDISSD